MKIEIKLHNPKYCNKCPLFGYWQGYLCDLDYLDSVVLHDEEGAIRPQKCIEKHGE